jgi:hypothetical protein
MIDLWDGTDIELHICPYVTPPVRNAENFESSIGFPFEAESFD